MKEIIDIIHKSIYPFFDVCEDEEEPLSDKDKLLLEVNKAICNNLKALEQTRWIPVSERLPNLDDYTGSEVWQKKLLITGYFSFDDKKDTFVSEAFARDVVCNCVHNIVVTAWQPLPEPYKAEKGGEV